MRKTYVVGDIHGSLHKLRTLVARCEREADGQPMRFVFLGDYIDRGPDSRGVVEYLIDLQSGMRGDAICLMGNHEALALAAVDSGANTEHWLMNGGDATLRSYGATLAHQLPAEHVAWFRSLPLKHDDGQRFFVHAGVDPARPLDAQTDHDLLWIREPFLSDPRDYGRLIVHGHTPTSTGRPDLRRNRLNIDTGAGWGRALTAAVFTSAEAGPMAYLQATE